MPDGDKAAQAEVRAVEFLSREVPAWSKENGCFSCHNNGDGARALYLAEQKGYRFEQKLLSDTSDWLRQPTKWDHNKGDPGFNDRRLMNVQFASSLLAGKKARQRIDEEALQEAVKRLLKDQAADGSWPIGAQATLGSPATYGTPLATLMAVRVLEAEGTNEAVAAAKRGRAWLAAMPMQNVMQAAVMLSVLKEDKSRVQVCLDLIERAQGSEGGWGPYVGASAEAFDTALVLLALSSVRDDPRTEKWIKQGREYLVRNQNTDGSWPETTRPPRGQSYAQQISTTGWALEALLQTRGPQ